ncbi:hypothetical protein Vadar_027579 [Vaccinium darrowii]|uniref:Uncharacterized protein n=1 Tax=Vaccinium darrowii TaxID=229202 RepID=A0ACB7YYW4_9ERIC|nr:hypothetical protein Vadar_027579 [Vaccinium darrowii]
MDDDEDMAEMYLTEKDRQMESLSCGEWNHCSNGMHTIFALVSTISSPPESKKLERSLSIARSRHESMRSTESIEELEPGNVSGSLFCYHRLEQVDIGLYPNFLFV